MGFFSRFEHKMEDAVEGTADKLTKSPISPVQISKQCVKRMMRNKIVGAGKQYAPTLYTVLVNPDDDKRLFSFYPTLAGEIETTIRAEASKSGLFMDGRPLVRFIVDDKLKQGKFDVIAECVASSTVAKLRIDEMEYYGMGPAGPQARPQQAAPARGPRAQEPANYGYAAPAPVGSQATPSWDEGQYQDDPYEDDPYEDQLDEDDLPVAGPPEDFDPYAPRTPSPNGPTNGSAPAGDTPHPQQRASSQAMLVDNTNHNTYVLSQSGTIAGRSKDCNIVVPDINASRHHARFICDASGRWAVDDLGSKNGTLVNGGYVKETTPLYDGDTITLGLTTYTYTVR